MSYHIVPYRTISSHLMCVYIYISIIIITVVIVNIVIIIIAMPMDTDPRSPILQNRLLVQVPFLRWGHHGWNQFLDVFRFRSHMDMAIDSITYVILHVPKNGNELAYIHRCTHWPNSQPHNTLWKNYEWLAISTTFD